MVPPGPREKPEGLEGSEGPSDGQVTMQPGKRVMVDFMCPLAWATRWPNMWSDIILDVSVSMFLDETVN